jgi:hypothetical protein
VSSTNVTNQQFVRVDFYRLGGGEYQYLGSVNTPAVADQGNTRFFTYVLPDAQFAALPTSFETQQPAIATGDNVIAIGVRANGSGLVTGTATVIGSQLSTISIPVTGCRLVSRATSRSPARPPASARSSTGPASIQVNPGTVCTVTPNNSSPAPGTGLIFTPTPNAPFNVTAGAAGTTTTGTTINYTGWTDAHVAISGLPAGFRDHASGDGLWSERHVPTDTRTARSPRWPRVRTRSARRAHPVPNGRWVHDGCDASSSCPTCRTTR